MTALEYFKGDELAASVWQNKYACPGEQNPDDMHRRLAKAFEEAEQKYGYENFSASYYYLMKDFKYIIPQGSIMSILGSKKIGSLSNCFFVGHPEDSYGGIFEKDQQLAQLMKRRGGVGIDISSLRPKDRKVSNSAESSTGAVSFMERFSNTTREVAQDGRRGALMISIDCRHPDIFDFATIKQDLTKVTGANISVKIRDDFMQAVVDDQPYLLRWPCTTDINTLNIPEGFHSKPIHLENCTVQRIKARDLWDTIIKSAHATAEPGLLFLDNHWKGSPETIYPQYRGEGTNPCGEIFMQSMDACRLLLLNLYSFVINPFTTEAYIDENLLEDTAASLMTMADMVVSMEIDHITKILEKIDTDTEPDHVKRAEREMWLEIRQVAASGRRAGCGITGLGDMLAALNIPYGSNQARVVTEKILRRIYVAQLRRSTELAEEFGPFKGYDETKEKSNPYQSHFNNVPNTLTMRYLLGRPRRNVSWSTVAPAGSVSILTGTTSGIEPLFQPYYIRRKKVNPGEVENNEVFIDQNGDHWQNYAVIHPKFKEWIQIIAPEFRDVINFLPEAVLDKFFTQSPWYKSTAADIPYTSRIAIQSTIQKFITHSISSTINLPENTSVDQCKSIYLDAWRQGLKGITIYREGCRTGVLVNKDNKFKQHDAPKRPTNLECDIHVVNVKKEIFNVIVGLFENKPYEVFALSGKHFPKGKATLKKNHKRIYSLESETVFCENVALAMTDEHEAITRLISGMLRHGANIKFIVEQLNKTPGDLTSFTKAISRTLKKYISDGEKATGIKCFDCGSTDIIYEEGCQKCRNCGNSKCG